MNPDIICYSYNHIIPIKSPVKSPEIELQVR